MFSDYLYSLSFSPYCVTTEVVWISSLHDQSIFKPSPFFLLPKVEYAVVVLNIVDSSDCLAGAVVLFLHPSWTAVHPAGASERWLLGKKPIPLVTLYVPVLYFYGVFFVVFFPFLVWNEWTLSREENAVLLMLQYVCFFLMKKIIKGKRTNIKPISTVVRAFNHIVSLAVVWRFGCFCIVQRHVFCTFFTHEASVLHQHKHQVETLS